MSSIDKAFNKTFSRQPFALRLPQNLPQLSVLFAAGCLTTMTGGLISPVLPEIVQQLHLDPKWAGTLVGMHALTIALFTPLLGILADRIGKLKVMIPSLIGYAIFGTAGAFLSDLSSLLVARGLLGAASGGIAAASIGFLGNMYEGEARSRILGYATSAMTATTVVVPIVAGWIGGYRWQYAFYLYSLSIPLACIAGVVLREGSYQQPIAKSNNPSLKDLGKILRHQQTLKLYLVLALAAAIVTAVVIYTPLYLKQIIGAGPKLNGLILAIRAIGAAVISAIGATWLSKQIGVNRAIAVGFVLMAVMVLTIPLVDQLAWIMIIAALFGIGFGIITPNAYNALASCAPPELRASVLAIGTGANSLGQFISPLLLGPIWKSINLSAVFYATAAIALAVALLSLSTVTTAEKTDTLQ
jgi:predicted MFS family arabinose efflux permease